MKKILAVLIFSLLSSISYSQMNSKAERINLNVESENESYIRDGQEFVRKFANANGIDLDKIAQEPEVLRKTSAWSFSVGSKYDWWSLDRRAGAPSSFYKAASTCRAVGANCYIFVEDSLWSAGDVDQTAIDGIKTAFDSSTPANSSKGIFHNNVETFGNPPNVDGDARIIIFVLRIRDDVGTDGGFTAGYFYSGNQSTVAANSNKAEIYYMEGAKLNLKSVSGSNTANAIMAHEFQHMIQYNYKRTNPHATFFNEGCSMLAEVVNGYSIRLQSQFASNPGRYLLNWSDESSLADYGRAARFMLYIKEQFGIAAVKKFVQSVYSDITAFNIDVLPTYGSRTFKDVLGDWFIANYVNNKSVDPKWGYDYAALPRVASSTHLDPNVAASASTFKLAPTYINYGLGTNLSITFSSANTFYLKIKAIKSGASAKVIEDVTFSQNYTVPEFGTTYNDVAFVVYQSDPTDNISTTTPINFTYSSTGNSTAKVTELAYDNKEPAGIYAWAVGDSVAVGFDGYSGMKLDSIKVALRTLTAHSGGVWRLATSGSNLFGTPLAVPITAAGKIYNGVPYPIPWNNWGKVDLRSYNIDAASPYVVSFVVDGAYQGGVSTGPNRVMHTYQPETNSLTYTTGSSGRRWYKYTVDKNSETDSLIVYLIRAYISNFTTRSEPIELLPTTFALDQNYPNPFNPSTVISFQLPRQGNVEIKIYDAVGKEVKTLIKEFRDAGKYNIMWNGDDNYGRKVSSGIYFYAITADNFSQTKKMVLMR